MNEFLQDDEEISYEETLLFAEAARLWEDESRDDKERKN